MDKLSLFKENKKNSSCNIIVVDDFYENPLEVREFALQQEYLTNNYYPGKRTKSFSNLIIKNKIQNIIENTKGKITNFPLYDHDNGSFQYATSKDKTWIHSDDIDTNMAGVLYLTPNAPVSSGTTIYRLKQNGICNSEEQKLFDINITQYNTDYSKWEAVDTIGNIFNRLILFNSTQFHCSTNYFGTDINNGRLFQIFFFSTEF